MNNEIKAGINFICAFTTPNNKVYKKYISYIDRDNAIRKNHVNEFDIISNLEFDKYTEYMGNPSKQQTNKISGLFTKTHDELTKEEIKKLKELFLIAENNNSLMWQPIFSFDNRWLESVGIYDSETKSLNEYKLKNATRKAMEFICKEEHIENGMWTAAIHYNTDNIHIHIALVEPMPTREARYYTQYEKVRSKDGREKYKLRKNPKTDRYEKIPILDSDGNYIFKKEFKGKFKQKTIKKAKSSFVSSLMINNALNLKIENIIRKDIVEDMKKLDIVDDINFKDLYSDIINCLPENKNLCNYNNNIMKPTKTKIDKLSNVFIEKHYKKEFEELLKLLDDNQQLYSIIYGGSNNYKENKLDELKTKMGNTILQSIKTYHKQNQQNEKTYIYKEYKNSNINNIDIEKAIKLLKRSLYKDVEHYLNLCDYENLELEKILPKGISVEDLDKE